MNLFRPLNSNMEYLFPSSYCKVFKKIILIGFSEHEHINEKHFPRKKFHLRISTVIITKFKCFITVYTFTVS